MGEDKKRVAVKLEDKFQAALLDQANCPATIREIMQCQVDFQLSIVEKRDGYVREPKPTVVDFAWKTANAFPARYTQGWQQCLNTNLLAMQSETIECLETTNWKPWRTNFATEPTAEQKQDAKYELIDVMCFLMNSFMLLGGTPDEFSAMYFAKMGENHNRQATGY